MLCRLASTLVLCVVSSVSSLQASPTSVAFSGRLTTESGAPWRGIHYGDRITGVFNFEEEDASYAQIPSSQLDWPGLDHDLLEDERYFAGGYTYLGGFDFRRDYLQFAVDTGALAISSLNELTIGATNSLSASLEIVWPLYWEPASNILPEYNRQTYLDLSYLAVVRIIPPDGSNDTGNRVALLIDSVWSAPEPGAVGLLFALATTLLPTCRSRRRLCLSP